MLQWIVEVPKWGIRVMGTAPLATSASVGSPERGEQNPHEPPTESRHNTTVKCAPLQHHPTRVSLPLNLWDPWLRVSGCPNETWKLGTSSCRSTLRHIHILLINAE